MIDRVVITLLTYSLAVWLALYLIARRSQLAALRFSAYGLLCYAMALALEMVQFAGDVNPGLVRFGRPLLLLPLLFWAGALIHLLPSDDLVLRVTSALRWLPVVALVVYLVGASTGVFFEGDAFAWTPAGLLIAFPVLLLCLFAAGLLVRARTQPLLLASIATLFFSLGVSLLFLSILEDAAHWLLVGIGVDLLLLGLAVAAQDAFEQGEALRYDIRRSLMINLSLTLLFGGQIIFVIWSASGVTVPLTALLLAVVTTVTIVHIFADSLQRLLDQLLLQPTVTEERAALRESASALPRLALSPALARLDEDGFTRQTRRALRHLGDLTKLATSPLTDLPQLENNLSSNDAKPAIGETLARAAALRELLTQRIEQLRPTHEVAFSTAATWRHYNALYFPYIVGIRPYSRRAAHVALTPAGERALEWFRTSVPERTLYNWQNAAARLIAQDLWREMQAHSATIQNKPQTM